MARTVRDANLGTRAARQGLPIQRKPYYRIITQGLHLGYYKGSRASSWTARRFLGDGQYEECKLGTADDVIDADGLIVLSFSEAQERARAWFAQRALADAGGAPDTTNYTVSNALDDYTKDYERRGGKAIDRINNAIEAQIRPILGDILLSKLTQAKLETWQDDLVKSPPRLRTKKGKPQRYREADLSAEGQRRRKATVNRTWTVLRAALSLAYDRRKVVSKDVWERIKPYREADAAKIRYLTDAEIKDLLKNCAGSFKELVTGALLTGARYGELCAMSVGDLDLQNETIVVPKSKSGKARHLDLTEEGAKFFLALANGRPDREPMFIRSDGERWGHAHQSRPMRKACDDAKISPAIGFHILRHTYASRGIMNGLPLNVIAQQLGHADTRMTEKHYAHLSQSYRREMIREKSPPLGLAGSGDSPNAGGNGAGKRPAVHQADNPRSAASAPVARRETDNVIAFPRAVIATR